MRIFNIIKILDIFKIFKIFRVDDPPRFVAQYLSYFAVCRLLHFYASVLHFYAAYWMIILLHF